MPTPLFRSAELRSLERQAAVGLPAGTLMQRAGAAAARWVLDRHPLARRIVVVCGPGNNGGDGYSCAAFLKSGGRDVRCVALGAPVTDDAKAAARRWRDSGGITLDALPVSDDVELGIDAMFGIGLGRPLSGAYLDAAHWLNALPAGCIALDVPSGLDADTGAWVGDLPGVTARQTLSFLGAKPGLFTAHGTDACGQVVIDTLGIALPTSAGALNATDAFAEVSRPRPRNSHKGSFGEVLVVGGAAGMVGAALLAARAALRVGAGRVYVDLPDRSLAVDPSMPELMFRDATDLAQPFVTVIGCGLGRSESARARLAAAFAREAPLVIDADGLNLVAADEMLQARLIESEATRVLTPHPAEAARLLQTDGAAIQADRIDAAQALAHRFKAIVVLKGAGSVIAAGETYWINPTGGPALATAGTGDVLAGMLGALLAQGHAPLAATLAAVWLHGQAADAFDADVGLVAGDIAPRAAGLLAQLRRA